MKWASSLSTQSNLEASVEECARKIKENLQDLPAHLSVIFVSPHFKDEYERVPEILRKHLDPGVLLGCSGGGIIGGGQEAEQKAAVSLTVAHLPDVEIQPVYSDTMDLPDQDTGPGVWREWLGVAAEKSPQFIFLADPFSFRGEEFLSGMDFAYPNSRKVGGLASGAQRQGGNALYLDDKIYRNGLIGVALSGNIQLDTIVAQGCRPIGQPMTISKCSQNLLQELGGRPPIELLEEMAATMDEYDQKLIQTSLFLGVEMDPLKDDPVQGDFLIRNLMGADRSTGAIAIGAELREGMLVQFHLRDKKTSAEDLDLLLTRYQDQSSAQSVQGALLFSCLGRGEYLYGEPNHDCDLFKSRLGDAPLGGFFCNGEIGPVGQSTFLHGYTSSFGLFKPTT